MTFCFITKNCLFLAAGLFFCITVAAQKKPVTGKEPAWITVESPDYNNSRLNREAEDGYIDLDYQKQVSLGTQSVYIKQSFKILSEAGVQNKSQVSISFDPSYQSLIIHTIRIIRDGQIINKLELNKLKTIQQETELDRFIYNGTLKSVLFVEDVRKNDVLEYSYTLQGFNPIFQNKYSDFYDTRFSTPLCHLYYKLIVPAGRIISIHNNADTVKPYIHSDANQTIYEWRLTDNHAVHVQDALPAWYEPFGYVMVSEYKTWKEVADWATALFPEVKNVSLPLRKKIEALTKPGATVEDKVKAALRFVQDDIRYMGLEMGVHSHEPATPDKIFERRFGDCKEKSYLLVTMLRQMGIEAYPVLINASYTQAINTWLPSPFCFDHVTVKAVLKDGDHWFDPTISFQRGNLSGISYPDYKKGLIVSNSTTALTSIPLQEQGEERVKETFLVKDMLGKAGLKVVTEYSGSYADDIRDDFNNNSDYDLLKDYKQFYQGYFSHIIADSLHFNDDSTSGKFITTEYYTIDSFWNMEPKGLKTSFTSYVINGVIKKPKEQSRTMPFYLRYPARYHEEIEINLPEDWDAKPYTANIRSSGFVYKVNCTTSSRKIALSYDFENLKDNITPNEAADFFNKLKQVDAEQDYEITTYASADDEKYATAKNKATNPLYVAIPILLIIGSFVWWTQRKT